MNWVLTVRVDAEDAELEQLIEEQARDMRSGHRVHSLSLNTDLLAEDGTISGQTNRVTDDRHGTIYAYFVLKCRCEKCRSAARVWRADYVRRRLKRPVAHGKDSTYTLGCRCDDCKVAHSEYRKQRRIAKKQAA